MNIPVKTSDLVGKDGQVPDIGAMSGPGAVAFTLPKGAISGPINVGRVGVVLTVTDKQEPSAEEIAKNFAQTRETAAQRRSTTRSSASISATWLQKYEKAGAIRYSRTSTRPRLFTVRRLTQPLALVSGPGSSFSSQGPGPSSSVQLRPDLAS